MVDKQIIKTKKKCKNHNEELVLSVIFGKFICLSCENERLEIN